MQVFKEIFVSRRASGHTVEMLLVHLDWLLGACSRVIRAADRKCLAFRCLGHCFIKVTIPFCLASAPLTCTKVMRTVVGYLRERNFCIIAFVDYVGCAPAAPYGTPATAEMAQSAYRFVARLFGELGLRLHPIKGMSHGPTRVRPLGHLFDTRLPRFLLPDDRVDTIVRLATVLARGASHHHRWVNFVALRRF